MKLSKEEQKIYEELLKKYEKMPNEQERVKFEVEQGTLPSVLKDWEEMR